MKIWYKHVNTDTLCKRAGKIVVSLELIFHLSFWFIAFTHDKSIEYSNTKFANTLFLSNQINSLYLFSLRKKIDFISCITDFPTAICPTCYKNHSERAAGQGKWVTFSQYEATEACAKDIEKLSLDEPFTKERYMI